MDLLNPLSLGRANRLFVDSRFKATCSVSDEVGDVVHMNNDELSGVFDVRRCDPTVFVKMPAVGIIVEKPTVGTCIVQTAGTVTNVSAPFTTGKLLFVAEDGTPTHTPPLPNVSSSVFIQAIGVAKSSTKLTLAPSFHLTKRVG